MQGIQRFSWKFITAAALLICALFACPAIAHADMVNGDDGPDALEVVSSQDDGADEEAAHSGLFVSEPTLSGETDSEAVDAFICGDADDADDTDDTDDTEDAEDAEDAAFADSDITAVVADSAIDDGDEADGGSLSAAADAVENSDVAAATEGTGVAAAEISEDEPAAFFMALAAASSNAPVALTAQASKFVIVIDPGHGGYDGGASGYVVEKNANLTIAMYLRQELAKYSNVQVYMTRTDDTYVSLDDRVKMAVNWGANLVISVHNNAGGGSGSEVIVPNSSSWYYKECYVQGQTLGKSILAELRSVGLGVHSGVYSRNSTNNSRYKDGSMSDYYTLVGGPREAGILGIIVEHAFVDSSTDARFLQSDASLKNLALADARGIVKTYGFTKTDLTTVKYSAPLAAGTYVIATANDGRQVLDVSGGSKSNGANVLLWGWHDAAWQKWEVSFDAQGLYTFKNVGTGKVLDVAGADAFRGTNVLSWQNKTTDYYNQRWILVKSGVGYIIKSALDSDYVLDCMGGGSANGTNVALWNANGGNNQRFCFVDQNPSVAFGQTIANGVYTLGVSNRKTQLVEVYGRSTANSANVNLYGSNGGTNQQWSFQYNGAGYYKIINVNSGLALDVAGANICAGTNVLQYASKSGKNQLWGVAKNSDGTYSIYSALNGMALDVHGASTANLANIEVYYSNGGANQKFYLTAAPDYGIMGASTVTAAQMAKYYAAAGASYPISTYSSKGAATINEFAKIALEEANAEGVRAEVLFAQAMLETGNLKFGGSVSASQCNFGGIGATGGSVKGATFTDVRTGLRAQTQHLKAYASTAALNNACVDPRFNLVTRGSATTVGALSGKWAADTSYGAKIAAIINNIKKL